MLAGSVRRFATSALRRGHFEDGPGKNMPFSNENKWRFLAITVLFVFTACAGPGFLVRHQLKKA